MANETITSKQLRPDWRGLEDTPILFCNQFLIQHVENEFVITFGSTTGPLIFGPLTPEEAQKIDSVPVKTVFRVGVTPDRLIQLIGVLEQNLLKYQQRTLES